MIISRTLSRNACRRTVRQATSQAIRQAIAFLLGVFLFTAPANAHLTEVSGDIAGTWHVEPNHQPKAGEPAQVWVALTQRGGKIVPFDQCDCQLTVYQGNGEQAVPLLKPSLQAIAAENYQGIPGAEVVFPQVGQYRLKFTGRPKAEASFQPFELNYTVTVATGKPPTTEAPAPQPQTTAPNSNPTADPATPERSAGVLGKALIGFGAIVLILGGVGFVLRQQKMTKL